MRYLLIAFAACASPSAIFAFEPGASEFVWSSDLALDGFVPIATSGAGNSVFGMSKGSDIYLCFLADTAENQAKRQEILLAELGGKNPERTVPNMPVVCILTQ